MADISDVQNTIAAIVAGGLYPRGTALPSVVGSACKIYAGWPTAKTLDEDVRLGVSHVSVFATKGENNTTRYERDWREIARGKATIKAQIAANGTDITFSGVISAPQNIAVHTHGRAFTYAVQSFDTFDTMVGALAILINEVTPATSNGPVLTIPAAAGLKINIGVGGTLARILKHQERTIMVTTWAPTPQLRTKVSKILDPLFAELSYLRYPDGSHGRIIYHGTYDEDEGQKQIVYRRDLTYRVEYPTLEIEGATEIVTIASNIQGGQIPTDINPVTAVSSGLEKPRSYP